MKIIISGGGTGGHIYPALAVADALKKAAPQTEILFVGAKGKMEMQQVPAAGYPIIGLSVQGLQRNRLLANLKFPFKLVKALWQSHQLLKTFRPAVVLGTGGYASGPLLYMAARHGIPTLIQEQNAVAGFTNRMLGRYADKVCVAYEQLTQYFPPQKIVLTGNPVRQGIRTLGGKRTAAHAHFGLSPHKKCLLVLGGSGGALTINESILQGLD
ncbi:MAG: glycosyltransferase, partial [Bacteroidota bacterium]